MAERDAQRRAGATTAGPPERAPAPVSVPALALATQAIGVLGARRDVDALPLLVHLFNGHPDATLRLICARALTSFDEPQARAALDARWADADGLIAEIAVRALLRHDLTHAWSGLERYFAVASVEDEVVTGTVLRAVAGDEHPRRLTPEDDPLLREPRFVDLAARLRRHLTLGPDARHVLQFVPLPDAIAAIARHPIAPEPAAPAVLPARRDHLARYLAGEHRAWNELVAAASAVLAHDDLRREATAVAEALMRRVRRNADAVRATLRAACARLQAEAPPAGEDLLARLEAAAGPVPIALGAFYRVVGEISLLPARPTLYDYGPCALEADGIALLALDPLAVSGPDDLAYQLEQYEDEVALSHPDIVGPFRLDVAPDYLHKQNISGGPPYGFELPPTGAADALDPFLDWERHDVSFVEYLRLAFRWGGFPGLDVLDRPPEEIFVNLR